MDNDDGDDGLVLFPASEHSDQRLFTPHNHVVDVDDVDVDDDDDDDDDDDR